MKTSILPPRRASMAALLLGALLAAACTAHAGNAPRTLPSSDSDFVFMPANPTVVAPQKVVTLPDAWGVDILISNNGFGLGGFLRHEYSEDLSGIMTIGFSEAKDDNQVEYIDYYGETIVPGKINRFILVPLHFGVQYRLFSEDIVDNFRPYINAAVGPTLVFSSPFDREFFNSLGYGQAHYTLGGYIGLGAFFGAGHESLSGVNIRYYIEPIAGGIDSMMNSDQTIEKKKDFGGFFITFNFGSLF
ncbi:MAG TPA: hypothetical protein VMG34_01195 [Bacteroidota bacterium]|nr:hypothetical protein [Bacteroidota bacterium]